jgi:hypothetical protein
MIGEPRHEPLVPRKAIIWTLIALVILVGGLAASIVALKRAENWAAKQRARSAASLSNRAAVVEPGASRSLSPLPFGFRASSVTLKRSGGTLVAVGNLTNRANLTRSGIRLEIALYNSAGAKISTATGYKQSLAPGAEWDFEIPAPVLNAASARITSVSEGQ